MDESADSHSLTLDLPIEVEDPAKAKMQTVYRNLISGEINKQIVEIDDRVRLGLRRPFYSQ